MRYGLSPSPSVGGGGEASVYLNPTINGIEGFILHPFLVLIGLH